MTDIPISPAIWKLAALTLTTKQLCVLDLRERHGYSWNQLAINLNCTRANVREHHTAATRKLLNLIEAAGGIDQALELADPTMYARTATPAKPVTPATQGGTP